MPSSSSSSALRILRARVSASLALSHQQINSLRASGVRVCHRRTASALAARALRRSVGTLWTVPPGIAIAGALSLVPAERTFTDDLALVLCAVPARDGLTEALARATIGGNSFFNCFQNFPKTLIFFAWVG